ncbi:MAG: tetratricopeptide repeat protein [Vicingaceae bacterium]
MKKLIFMCLMLFTHLCGENSLWAQERDQMQTQYALARQAKDNAEWQKAIDYFEELYDQKESEVYYRELVDLYPRVDAYKEAEKLIKKRIRKFPEKLEYIVDQGNIAEQQGDESEAEKIYESAIDELDQDVQKARLLANQFNRYKLFNYAEQVYVKARKVNRNEELFRFELANVYAQQGKTSEMIEIYLDVVGQNRSYLKTVQNIFSRVLYPDPENKQMEELREQLLGRIQKQPNQEVYAELLIWLYLQDKNFKGAFIQAKALDRKANELGKRLHSLGQLALSNKAYTVAEQSFEYVIQLGNESPYYLSSKMKLVETLKEKITQNAYSPADLSQLETAYSRNISELGKSSFTLSLIRGQASLYAYYLDQVDTAIVILNQAIEIPGISKEERAEIKIELADLLLLDNDIWEASLLYSQVEKDFKYDRLGETAKFKNAKVAFYTGDFYWAQAQLDVLKGSTSKLIANDALDLSLLITENIGLDSIAEPLEMYARADLMIFKQDYAAAEKSLDSIPKFFPQSSLKDDILFTKFEIELKKRNYEKAAEKLRTLIADYGEDVLGDDALFELAKLEEERFGDKETAMDLYKRLITTYPSSLHVVESRKRFRKLRGDNLESTEQPKSEEEL